MEERSTCEAKPVTLRVKHTVFTGVDRGKGPFLNFYQWVPNGSANSLRRADGEISVVLTIDRDCVNSLAPVTQEYIDKWVNVHVGRCQIDVWVPKVPRNIAQFIYDERDQPQGLHHGLKPGELEYDELSKEYRILGERVLEAALVAYNRLIAFCRDSKGQFWLSEHVYDPRQLVSDNNGFDARVLIDDEQTFVRWCPPGSIGLVSRCYGEERSVTKADWAELQLFFAANNSTEAIAEILSNAEQLIEAGHRRSAIVEAVSALEAAVWRFARKPKAAGLLSNTRVDLAALGNRVEHLGFSTSFSFLIPLLIPASDLTDEDIRVCRQAIDVRNNVVHNVQRDVEDNKVRKFVHRIRRVSNVLLGHSE